MNEYPRLTRSCTRPGCKGRQQLRTKQEGKRGTWRCSNPDCRRVEKADLNDPKVREFLNLMPIGGN